MQLMHSHSNLKKRERERVTYTLPFPALIHWFIHFIWEFPHSQEMMYQLPPRVLKQTALSPMTECHLVATQGNSTAVGRSPHHFYRKCADGEIKQPASASLCRQGHATVHRCLLPPDQFTSHILQLFFVLSSGPGMRESFSIYPIKFNFWSTLLV